MNLRSELRLDEAPPQTPRIGIRRLLILGATALALRLGTAALTEFHPIFPDYYYTDATLIDETARFTVLARQEGKRYPFHGSLGQRAQVEALVFLYSSAGYHPFYAKLANVSLGTMATVLLALALTPIFGAPTALSTAFMFALWPSCIFYTSHNFKEAPVCALAYASLALLSHLFTRERSDGRAIAMAFGASLLLICMGLLRPPIMLALGGATIFAAIVDAWKDRRWRLAPILAALAASTSIGMHSLISRELYRRFAAQESRVDENHLQASIIPEVFDYADSQAMRSPTSIEGINLFRKIRLEADRRWARVHRHRDIGTQIYPDLQFENWWQVALFLPKGIFTTLYLPLPGLYPMDGKIGRWAASLENIVLLALTALAFLGASRVRWRTPWLIPISAFIIITAAAGLLELDLGSASRHKILHFPFLLPLAFAQLLSTKHRHLPGQHPSRQTERDKA